MFKKELDVLMKETQMSWDPSSAKLALTGNIGRVEIISFILLQSYAKHFLLIV